MLTLAFFKNYLIFNDCMKFYQKLLDFCGFNSMSLFSKYQILLV